MKVFDKVKDRLLKEYGIDAYKFHRIYAGRCQRACGALSWGAFQKNTASGVGSYHSATELLKQKNWVLSFEHGTIVVNILDGENIK